MSSISNIVRKLDESRNHAASSYKGFTLKWEADDSAVEPHIIIYEGKKMIASAANDEEAKSIIDKDLLHEDKDDEAYQQFLADMKSNPTYKKIESLCSKYKYKLYTAFNQKYGDSVMTRVSIRETERYQPEIYYQDKGFGSNEYEFKIQTTSYGALTLEEHAEFLKHVTAAHELVAELSKLDFDSLLTMEKD